MIDITTLNNEQKEAVIADDKYIRIIAGAGSGKTRVLTTRIAYLIEERNVAANRILAITFTNKAANEMKERIKKMLNDDNNTAWISTIHSLCVRILREDITTMNYPRNFTIVDADDQKSILKEAYKEFDVDKSKFTVSSMLSYISNNKCAEVSTKRAYELANDMPGEMIKAKVYEFYENRLMQLYALDFDDLLLWTVRMFKKYPEVLNKWMNRFSYILVDEFQDVDHVQYELIKLLCGSKNNLCVVGDPDQTIYTWRGADVNIIMDFETDFKGCHTVILNQNYRSTKNILEGANSVIRNNRNRVKKDLFTVNEANDLIVHYSASNEEYEAVWIAQKILELTRKNNTYRDIAILYRSNYLSRSIEKALLESRIPYVIYGGVKFYERAEIKDALSYLRMIVTKDDLAFKRIINVPKRGIGNKTLDMITDKARENNLTMYEICDSEKFLSGKNQKTIDEFISMIKRWEVRIQDKSVADILDMVLLESGYKAYLEEAKETERLENLKELMNDMRSFSEDYPESSLDEYLQLVSLYGDKEEKHTEDYVSLMTVHAAKGLEFDNVFVIGMSDGIFPSERSMQDGNRGVEEERRLAYVAYTRAKKRLYLTDSSGFSYILSKPRVTSRFVEEVDGAYINHLNRPKNQDDSNLNINADETRVNRPINKSSGKKGFKKGDKVNHKMFGDGIVVKVKDGFVDVAFVYPAGVKKIMANHPSLTKK